MLHTFLLRPFSSALLTLLLISSSSAFADVPRIVAYQGRLAGFGAGPVDLSVSLSPSSTGGTALFSEIHDNVPLVNGVFSLHVGSQTTGGIPDAALNSTEIWLQLSVDSEVQSPRTRLGMVPYSAKANCAERLVTPSGFTTALSVSSGAAIGIGTTSPAAKLDVVGDIAVSGVPFVTTAADSPVVGYLRDIASVRDFGAVPNDDQDDSEAFNDALATGKLVLVPAG